MSGWAPSSSHRTSDAWAAGTAEISTSFTARCARSGSPLAARGNLGISQIVRPTPRSCSCRLAAGRACPSSRARSVRHQRFGDAPPLLCLALPGLRSSAQAATRSTNRPALSGDEIEVPEMAAPQRSCTADGEGLAKAGRKPGLSRWPGASGGALLVPDADEDTILALLVARAVTGGADFDPRSYAANRTRSWAPQSAPRPPTTSPSNTPARPTAGAGHLRSIRRSTWLRRDLQDVPSQVEGNRSMHRTTPAHPP